MSKKMAAALPLGSVEVTVLSCRCRCGHEWISRDRERPRVCPKCKSPNWDRPKKWERGASET